MSIPTAILTAVFVMAIVFLVLVLLIGAIKLQSTIIHRLEDGRAQKGTQQ